MKPEIRQAEKDDLPALSGLLDGKAKDYFERCLAEQDEGRRVILIATLNEQPVGYGMLNRSPQYVLYKKLGIPEIQDLNVIPAARRQGVASAMIAHCENLARSEGNNHIGISVGLHAAFGPAQRLYIKLGYMPDGFGVTYDRQPVSAGEFRPVDDDLCLMLVKDL